MKAWGGVLALLSAAPLYLLLGASEGPAAAQFRAAGPGLTRAMLATTLVVLGLGVAVGLRSARPWEALVGGVARTTPSRVGWLAAVLAFVSALGFSLGALGGGPYLVDGMSQLLQARLFAHGSGSLPADPSIAFSYYQYLAAGAHGWLSQYPPGFAAMLAPWLLLGVPWLLGPTLHAATAYLGVRFAERLFPGDRALVLVAASLLALSPFGTALAGSYMNHGLAALLGLMAVHAAWGAADADARSGRAERLAGVPAGLIAGASVGALAAVRPLTAVVVAAAAGVAYLGRREARGGVLRFAAFAGTGALLPTGVLLWYNARHFGAPLTFGYTVAQGPGHGLGFHVDPWGAAYGPREALAYTSTELSALGTHLAGVPLPLTVWVGLALVLLPTTRALWPLVAWSAGLVVAGAAYWHHDLSMGPRLLADGAPAWVLLAAWATVTTVRRLGAEENAPRTRTVRGVALVAIGAALVAAPLRLVPYAQVARASDLLVVADAPAASLVFVHDAWESRLAARLGASGLRDDQIRAVLESWTTCELHTALQAVVGPGDLATRLLAGGRAPSAVRTMPSGSTVRTLQGEALTPECERQARSDFNGIAGLPQRSWRGDLPGAERGRPMYVRDLGPEANRAALARYPDRSPYVLVPPTPASPARLWPYEDGMERLWGAEGRP